MRNWTNVLFPRGFAFFALSLACAMPALHADIVTKVTIVGQLQMNGGIWGDADATGSWTEGLHPADDTSNITVVEGPYTYTFSGPVNGSDYSNHPSQQPPTLCILAGCNPFGAPLPGTPLPVTFSLAVFGATVDGSFEDDLKPFGGQGTVSVTTLTPSSTPEPTMWIPLGVGIAAIFVSRKRFGRSGGIGRANDPHS